MPESGELPFKSPLIKSGPTKAKIRNQDTAHQVSNTILGVLPKKHSKAAKIQLLEDQGSNDFLIAQAAKTVKVEEQAQFDPLTNLRVKAGFKPSLQEELNHLLSGEVDKLGVIKFDLDYFSWINDILEAHHLGDIYLESVGNIIRNKLRPQDLGFRVGGDEFAVIIKETISAENFLHVVDRIHTTLNSQILRQTLATLLNSKREINDKSGNKEREGTLAIREILTGLVNLNSDIEGRKSHFLAHGRGDRSEKEDFLNRLTAVDFDQYSKLFTDTRFSNQLSDVDLEERSELEKAAVDVIQKLMSNLGVSTAGLYLSAQHHPTFPEVDKSLEEMLYQIKRKGGRQYSAREGLNGTNIQDRRIIKRNV